MLETRAQGSGPPSPSQVGLLVSLPADVAAWLGRQPLERRADLEALGAELVGHARAEIAREAGAVSGFSTGSEKSAAPAIQSPAATNGARHREERPRLDVREIRRALSDPEELARRLGLLGGRKGKDWFSQRGRGVKVRCVAHDEHTPSLSLMRGPDGTIACRCFGCDWTADGLGLIAQVEGLSLERDFPEVLEVAARIAGHHYTRPVRPAPPPRHAEPKDEESAAMRRDFGPFKVGSLERDDAGDLVDPEAASCVAYLEGRGLYAAAVRAGFGFNIGDPEGYALAIGWRDRHASVQVWQRRRIDGLGANKYLFPRDERPAQPFGVDFLDDVAVDAPLAIVEGALDTIALRDHPIGPINLDKGRAGAVVGVPGVGSWRDFDWAPLVLGRRCVLIALDANDAKPAARAATERACRELAMHLRGLGVADVRRLVLVGAEDWTAALTLIGPVTVRVETDYPEHDADPHQATTSAPRDDVDVEREAIAHEEESPEPARATRRLEDDPLRAAVANGTVADRPPRLAWLSAAEMTEALPPVAYVVEALDLSPGRPAQLVGPGFSGKTLCAQQALLDIAAGRPVWGKFAAARGVVAHLDYEMGKRPTLRRYRRLAFAMGIDWPEFVPWLRLAPFPSVYLNSPDCGSELERGLDGCTLALVDSLRRSSPGEDENDSRITRHLDVLLRVSERTGCTVIFLHHQTTKSGPTGAKPDERGAGRGSSAIFDASGSVFTFAGSGDGRAKVTQTRANERGVKAPPFGLAIEDVESEDGRDPRAGLRVRWEESDTEETHEAFRQAEFDRLCDVALDTIKARPGMTGRLLEDMVRTRYGKVGSHAVRSALEVLRVNGAARGIPGPRKQVAWYPLPAPSSGED